MSDQCFTELLGTVSATLIALILCGSLANMSYHYFEMPILKRRPPQFPQEKETSFFPAILEIPT
jgi:hypothetical protein